MTYFLWHYNYATKNLDECKCKVLLEILSLVCKVLDVCLLWIPLAFSWDQRDDFASKDLDDQNAILGVGWQII